MIRTLGPLDPLPEFKLVDLLRWAAETQDPRPELSVAYGNDIRENYGCPICGTSGEDFYKAEALAAHAKKDERCIRAQERVWATLHGWKLIGREIAAAQGVQLPTDFLSNQMIKPLVAKWLGACERQNLPVKKLTRIVDSVAPGWIVDAILIYEATPALKELERPRYLRAVARDVRKALGRIAS